MVGIKFKQKDIIGGFYKGHRLCKIYKGMRLVSDFCGGGDDTPEIDDGCILYSTNGDSTYRINNTTPSINTPSNAKNYVDCSTKGVKITTLRNMFFVSTDTGKQNFTKIDLSHLDLSTITDLIYTFQQTFAKNYSLREVLINLPEKVIENAIDSTTGYASMQYMFAYSPIEKITSNIAFYKLLYNFCPIMGISNENLEKIDYTITDGEKEDILLEPYTGLYNYMIVTQKVSGVEVVRYNGSSYSLSRQSDYDGTYHRLGVITTKYTSLDNFLQGNTNVTEFNGMRMNMSNCTSISKAFNTSTLERIKVTNWDVSNVSDFSNCFQGSVIEEIDLSGWKPNKSANVDGMFAVSNGVKRILIPEFQAFYNMDGIFDGITADSIEYIKCSCKFYKKVDGSETHCGLYDRFNNIVWDYECNGDEDDEDDNYPPYSILYSTNSQPTTSKFYINGKATTDSPQPNKTDELYTFKVDGVLTSLRNTLKSMGNLTSVKFVGEWDTSKVTDMYNFIYTNANLVSVSGKIADFDITSVTTMNGVISSNTNLESVDISNWKLGNKLTNAYAVNIQGNNIYCSCDFKNDLYSMSMNEKAKTLTEFQNMVTPEDCPLADTNNSIYYKANSNTNNNYFRTDNIQTNERPSTTTGLYISFGETTFRSDSNRGLYQFANNITNLTYIEFLPTWKTENATSAGYMFNGCSVLAEVKGLENINWTNISNLSYMFQNNAKLKEIDLSALEQCNNIENVTYMFSGCMVLESINFGNANLQNATNFDRMFYSCSAIKKVKCNCATKNFIEENYTAMGMNATVFNNIEWDTDC